MSLLGIDTHRIATVFRAFRSLYGLEQREIDAFLGAYVLFDGDWSNANGKRESHIVDYYNVLNHLCALGNVEKMYIPPLRDAQAGVRGNQDLFERLMVEDLEMPPEAQVLDIGCGRGRVAAHVSRLRAATVTGLNIDPGQIQNAREYADRTGLSARCRFVQGSLNDPLPFPDAAFDAVYQIQAFTYAKDKVRTLSEIARVLKPGARFSYLDWVKLPAFDAANLEHRQILRRTQAIIGAVDTPSVDEVTEAMRAAGFEILKSEDASIGGHQSALITSEDAYFNWARRGVVFGVGVRLLPRHFLTLFDRFVKDADAFIAADRMGLATTSWQVVCAKPLTRSDQR